jgi:D-3-phosphoglycerate dehydrogenase
MPKVLIADKLSPTAVKIFEDRGIDYEIKTGMSEEEFKAAVADADGLVVRSAAKPNAAIIEAGKKLKVIGRAGIGVDNVDIPAATKNGVIVMNTPFGNAITTAEHAISMMLSLTRNIPQASRDTHKGEWPKSKYVGTELFNKTLGVVGCGNIGSIVADRALGLKMKVIAFDPFLSSERAQKIGVEKVSLDELLERADFVTLHTPANEKTKGMINKDSIAKMKKGVRLINCARGALVVEEDLLAAIESEHVAGAAIDVYQSEPAKEHIFFGNDKIICTPHLGASTKEAQENVAVQVAEQIADYLLDGAVTNALNTPSITADEAPKLQPYMNLCSQLGSLVGQITKEGLEAISIEYSGDASELNTKPLTCVVLQGILSRLLGDGVNMVNASFVAKERNIEVVETSRSESKGYHTKVKIEVKTEKQSRSVSGTLFGGSEPRITEVDGVKIETLIGPHMLYIYSQDKPGMIASIGSILADSKVNIATFSLGRTQAMGYAISLVQVDGDIEDSILAKVKGIDGVESATALKFN